MNKNKIIYSPAVLKQIIEQKAQQIDEQDVFLSPAFSRIIFNQAHLILSISENGIVPQTHIVWEPGVKKLTAFTDGKTKVINAAHESIQSAERLPQRYLATKGVSAHEDAHILYSDFEKLNQDILAIEATGIFPYIPEESDVGRQNIELMANILKDDKLWPSMARLYGKIYNSIEDGAIEFAVAQLFPGEIATALKYLISADFYRPFSKMYNDLEADCKKQNKIMDQYMTEALFLLDTLLQFSKTNKVWYGDISRIPLLQSVQKRISRYAPLHKAFLERDDKEARFKLAAIFMFQNADLIEILAMNAKQRFELQQLGGPGNQSGSKTNGNSQGGSSGSGQNSGSQGGSSGSGQSSGSQGGSSGSGQSSGNQGGSSGSGQNSGNQGDPSGSGQSGGSQGDSSGSDQNSGSQGDSSGSDQNSGSQGDSSGSGQSCGSQGDSSGSGQSGGSQSDASGSGQDSSNQGNASGQSSGSQSGNSDSHQDSSSQNNPADSKQAGSNKEEAPCSDHGKDVPDPAKSFGDPQQNGIDQLLGKRPDTGNHYDPNRGKGAGHPMTLHVSDSGINIEGNVTPFPQPLLSSVAEELTNLTNSAVRDQAENEAEKLIRKEFNERTISYQEGDDSITLQRPSQLNLDFYNSVALQVKVYAKKLVYKIEQAIKDMRDGGVERGLPVGRRIDFRSLYREDERIFRKNRLPEDIPPMVVTVLIDESGSMGSEAFPKDKYNKRQACSVASLVIYEFCKLINIPVSVVGHHYSAGTQIRVYADFEIIDPSDKYRLCTGYTSGCNRDGTALNYCVRQMMDRDEDIRILLILSDGLPSSYGSRASGISHMKQVLDLAEKNKINVYAGGLFSNESDRCQVSEIYPYYFDISDISQLPITLGNIVKQHIVI